MTSKEFIRSLVIIHIAMIMGLIFFAVVAVYLHMSGSFTTNTAELRDIFLIIVPLFAFGAFMGSRFIFSMKLNQAKEKSDLTDKINEYRSILIIRFALLEGAALFSLVIYLLTGDYIFLIIAGLMVVYFSLLKPTTDKLIFDLELGHDDKAKIMNPDETVA